MTGLTALGLSLGISIPAMRVQAESQPVKTVDKKAMPVPQKPKAAIAPSNLVSGGASRGYFSGISENYSTEPPFSEQFHNQTLSSVPQKTGYIKAGSDETGALQLMYFHGTTISNELISQAKYGGYNQGEVAGAISGTEDNYPEYPMFMTPNFAIRRGDGSIWSWLYYNGNGSTSSPFLAGIHNDWKTADMGSNWRFWSMEQSPTGDGLNSVITLKFTGDFTFRTEKIYTLDFTMTLKPKGSNVDYTLAIRNVTDLVNPAMSRVDAELPDFWFGSQFDTMLGDGDNWVSENEDPDDVPLYYTGEDQGLYLHYGGYKLSFNFTSPNAPTGWGATSWRNSSFAKAGIENPTSLGQNGQNKASGEVAFEGFDSALHMVWAGNNLAVGDTREANYQVSISSNSAVLPIIELNKMTDNYSGGDYTVDGKVTYPATGSLTYYYIIDKGDPIKFEGPQNVGSNPKSFNFTIPNGKMIVGDNHQISVYALDENGSASETKYLRLTAKAELKTVDKVYYTGEEFDQFANFAGGLSVTMQPLTKNEITNTVIKKDNAASEEVAVTNWNQITANPGEYTITYTYKYGSDPEATDDNSISKDAKIKVVDRKKITLKYVDESLKPIEDKYLIKIPEEMKSGPHEKPYGSKFPLVKIPELLLDGKKYFEFVRFEYANRPAPDLTEDYVTFGDHDQVINVVYKDLRAKAPIKVELINIKDPADKIENTIPNNSPEIDRNSGHLVYTIDPTKIEPRPNVDDTIDLENYIEEFESNTPTNKLQLPKGYTIASKPELEKLGLKQENPKFGLEEVKTKFYVVKEKAKKRLTITHKCVNQTTFNRLPDIKQMVEAGETITINTKSSVHRPPLGYKIIGANWDGSNRVDRSLQYNTQTGMISGTIPASPDSPKLTILYRKF